MTRAGAGALAVVLAGVAALSVPAVAAADVHTEILTGPAGPTNDQTVTFTYDETTGNGVGFRCSFDGSPFGYCSASGYTKYNVAEGSHTFQVAAIDGTGTLDPTPASATFVVDVTPPGTAFDGTLPDPLTNQSTASIAFGGTDAGGTGVGHFECLLDDASPVLCTSPANLGPLADGRHVLTVRAVDAAGNPDLAGASVSWAVDATKPVVGLGGPLPDAVVNHASATVGFSADDAGSGVATVECSADGGAFAACTAPVTRDNLPDGSHSLAVRATDAAGNVSDTRTASWFVDTVAPTVAITAGPPADTTETSATIAFAADDGGGSGVASVRCSIDGAPASDCTSPLTASALAPGTHHAEIVATDRAGNAAAAPATVDWRVTGPPPPPSAAPPIPGPQAFCDAPPHLTLTLRHTRKAGATTVPVGRSLTGARVLGAQLRSPAGAVVVKHLPVRGLSADVDLTGRPPGVYVVRVTTRLRGGRILTTTAKVTAC